MSTSETSWTERWQLCEASPFSRDFNRNVQAQMTHPTRPTLLRLAAEAGETVLDVACASCIDYDYILNLNLPLKYAGIDITPKFVEHAKTLHPELDVRVGDARSLPYDDEAFDVAYCKDLLGHFPPDEWKLAVQEMWRVAKKRMMFAEFVFRDGPTSIQFDGLGFYQNWISMDELKELLDGLPRLAHWEVGPSGLGNPPSTIYIVDKKRKRK